VIVADEIAAQIDAMPDTSEHRADEYSWPAEDYGIVAPPFQAFFVEATTDLDGAPVQRGMVVYDRSAQIAADGPVRGERVPAGTRWYLHAYPFLYSRLLGRLEDYGSPTVALHLDSGGRLLDDPAALQVFFAGAAAAWPAAQRRDAAYAAASIVPMVLKAIGALHRRAPAEHVTPDPARQRQAQRRGELPRHSFYRLKVRPHAPVSPADFASIGAPARATAREHLVRGHFKIYTEEKPLFGRVIGAVWVPEHERGDDAIGKITKDYEVPGGEE
jgi:hypothetical protein